MSTRKDPIQISSSVQPSLTSSDPEVVNPKVSDPTSVPYVCHVRKPQPPFVGDQKFCLCLRKCLLFFFPFTIFSPLAHETILVHT